MSSQRIKIVIMLFFSWGCKDYTANDEISPLSAVKNGIWPIDTIVPFDMEVYTRKQGQIGWTYIGNQSFIPKAPLFYPDYNFIYEYFLTGPDSLNSSFSIAFKEKIMKVSRNNKAIMTAIDSNQLPGAFAANKWDKIYFDETRSQANYVSKSLKIGSDSGNIYYSLYRRTITKPNLIILIYDKEYYKIGIGLRQILSTRYINRFVNDKWQSDTITYSFLRK